MAWHHEQLHGMGLTKNLPCLAGNSDQPLHGQQGRAGSAQKGRQGWFRKRMTQLIHTDGQEAHWDGVGSLLWGELHPMSARPGHTPPSLLLERGSFLQWKLLILLGGTWYSWGARRSSTSKPALVMSRGSGTW